MVLRNAANAVVPATVSYDAAFRTGVMTPSSPLSGSTTYTATITGVQDVAGNALASSIRLVVHDEPHAPALPTVTMSASPASITSGAASTLTWSSTNATSGLNQPGHRDGRRIRHEVGEPDLHDHLHGDSDQRGRFGDRDRHGHGDCAAHAADGHAERLAGLHHVRGGIDADLVEHERDDASQSTRGSGRSPHPARGR